MSAIRRWWGPAAGVVVLLLTVAVSIHPDPLPGELGYIRWLQDLGEPVPSIADVVRTTTGTEAALIVGALPAIWLVSRHRTRGVAGVAIALVTMLVAQPLLKEIVDRPRPTPDQVEVRAEHESKSFPSGHSMSTTTVWAAAAVASLHRKRAMAVALGVPIALTGASSGVQGVHWPSDVLAGTLLGALAAAAMLHIVYPRGGRPEADRP